jgi:hypothetical protein
MEIAFFIILVLLCLPGLLYLLVQITGSEEDKLALKWGPLNAELVCPHCTLRGHVRTKEVYRKSGISGAKATGALLTGGLSVLATGLSRKDRVTQAHCMNCGSTWVF